MDIKDILEKYKDDFNKLMGVLCVDPKERDIELFEKQYTGEHEIKDRPDKIAGKGKTLKRIPQAKLIIRYQRKIVNMAVSFLFGDPVKLILGNKDDKYQKTFSFIEDIWRKSKLDYFNKKLARRLFVETKVAELWYAIIDNENKKHIKVALLCKKNGDDIYAHFNENGDMDAFARRYKLEELDGNSYEHIDIYTAEKFIFGIKKTAWLVKEKENLYGKIPVIYYDQDEPEWTSVESEIDRSEMLISKFADTNDYFGAPIIKIFGKISNPPEKGEIGKTLQFEGETDNATGKINYGDAKYLTWEQAPEAIKIEYDILKDIIYSITSTPDLSFSNVKGLEKTSGEALKFLFMDSILKSKDKEELFGEALTRRINLLKAILSVTNMKETSNIQELDISIKFGSILPQDMSETIKALSTARAGDVIMSEKGAVRQNPLVEDPEEEIKRMEEERGKLSKLGESYEP